MAIDPEMERVIRDATMAASRRLFWMVAVCVVGAAIVIGALWGANRYIENMRADAWSGK